MFGKLSGLVVVGAVAALFAMPTGAHAATLQGSTLDLQQGASKVFDDGDLHVQTDHTMWLDAPVLARASNAFSVGGALELRNTGTREYTGSQIYDDGQMHIQGTSGLVFVDNATRVAGQLTVVSGGAAITGNSTITGTLTGLTGLTVASGGATVTAGGLTVTAGGANITGTITHTGNSTRTGTVRQIGRQTYNASAPSTLGTATASVADLLDTRIILHTAGANDTITTPTAAALVAALPGTVAVGDIFSFTLSNAAAANTAALAGGSGVTVSGPATVAAATSRVFSCRATNVTSSSEAITCY